jgi:segregation and condensation protein B
LSDATKLAPEALIQALIFAAPRPVSVQELARAAELSEEEVMDVVARLEAQSAQQGLRLQRSRDRYQLVTAPEAAPQIEALLGLDVTLRLTQAAMETLAIVAYAQPVTRPHVEAIRGVNSDSTLRTLLSAGLIEEVGRADSLGRPILYSTTFEFLQQFGLKQTNDLPSLQARDSSGPQTPGPSQPEPDRTDL